MKSIINGKLYNTATMKTLVSCDAYHNGTYAGDSSVRVTKTGLYAFVVTSNGQDLYRQSGIEAIDKSEIAARIDGWRLDDEEVEALTAHGILTEA